MDTSTDTTGARAIRDRKFAVLTALLNLGPGAHKFSTIAARTGMRDEAVRRRLEQLVDAGLATRTRRGYYELCQTTAVMSRASGLLHPSATPLLDAQRLLDGLHHRTNQVVLLHTYAPSPASGSASALLARRASPSAASSHSPPGRSTSCARRRSTWTHPAW